MRGQALAGSLAVHCAIALLIVVLLTDQARSPRPGPRSGAFAIEVVDAPPRFAAPGGSPRAPVAALPAAPRQARAAASRPLGTPVRSTPAPVETGVETTIRIDEASRTAAGDELAGEVAGALGGGGAGGRGGGIGLGDGAGNGLGGRAGIANVADIASLPLPVPPRVSLARPPVLIWPTKDGPIVEAELYIARLQIDSDGLVAGVRLIRRFREPRDDDAEDAVWKFRYLPALDDDGHPIRATIEQPFMLHVR